VHRMTAALGNEVPRISRHQRVGPTRRRNFEEWHISVVRQDHGEWTRGYVLRERCERVEHAAQVNLGNTNFGCRATSRYSARIRSSTNSTISPTSERSSNCAGAP
jgi:hypothetical protein